MKMNGGPDGDRYCNPSKPDVDENGKEQPWTCPEDPNSGVPCCWDYLSTMRIPDDAVLVDWDFWVFDCMNGYYDGDEDGPLVHDSGNCNVEVAEKFVGEKTYCKDLSGEPVTWINSPFPDEYQLETAAFSGNILYIITVILAVLMHQIFACFFGAISWGVIDPPENEDFRASLRFAPTLMNWFWLFPTILPSAAYPPSICLQLSDIGGLPASYIISISRYWLGLAALCMFALVFAGIQTKNGESEQAANAGKIAAGIAGFMMMISSLLSAYLEVAGMIQNIMSLTTGVVLGVVFADIGRMIECCAGDYMSVATSE